VHSDGADQFKTFVDRREKVFPRRTRSIHQQCLHIGFHGCEHRILPDERFDERTTLLIHGKHRYHANVSDSPAGTIASLEHALDSFEDRLRERETDLAQSRRQSADLARQLDQPFEHEEKLAVASTRQQEVMDALDITKNQASAKLDEGVEQGTHQNNDSIQQTVAPEQARPISVAV